MGETSFKLLGLNCIILSIFLFLGGLYIPKIMITSWINTVLKILGWMFLLGGIFLYKILKKEND